MTFPSFFEADEEKMMMGSEAKNKLARMGWYYVYVV